MVVLCWFLYASDSLEKSEKGVFFCNEHFLSRTKEFFLCWYTIGELLLVLTPYEEQKSQRYWYYQHSHFPRCTFNEGPQKGTFLKKISKKTLSWKGHNFAKSTERFCIWSERRFEDCVNLRSDRAICARLPHTKSVISRDWMCAESDSHYYSPWC